MCITASCARDGTITVIDAPGAGNGSGQGTGSWSINPAGAIAGEYADANGVEHGYLLAPDGTFTTFEAPDAGTGSGQGTLGLISTRRGRSRDTT